MPYTFHLYNYIVLSFSHLAQSYCVHLLYFHNKNVSFQNVRMSIFLILCNYIMIFNTRIRDRNLSVLYCMPRSAANSRHCVLYLFCFKCKYEAPG